MSKLRLLYHDSVLVKEDFQYNHWMKSLCQICNVYKNAEQRTVDKNQHPKLSSTKGCLLKLRRLDEWIPVKICPADSSSITFDCINEISSTDSI